jgi:hypothetical protein
MTVEEKAIAFVRELQEELISSNHSGFYIINEILGVAHKSFMDGYNEAIRWRDPEKELPETDEMVLIQVQIRYTDTIVKVFPSIGILSECGLTHKMRLVDTHRSNGLIIGWRPIE